MLAKLFSRKKEISQTLISESEYPISKSGKDLLSSPVRATQIRMIKRLFSTTEEVWAKHYLYAIEQFSELVQGVPASEIHHHSEEGGLIDHTLEALHAGVRIAQGYVLPPNAEPEQIAYSSDRWRFGAFMAILAHDIGKIVTDIDIVYRERGGEFQRWHPWYGNLPVGVEYTYRYKKRSTNVRLAKSLHEKAAMSLLPRLLTREAAQWIFEDTDLLAQLFSTISYSTFGGQTLAEIVRTADSASVSNNLGADTGVRTEHSASVPLHEKLIVSLRKLINDGDLKRNKPGAALWVTGSETWVVSKTSMEAVRAQLINEGHKGIPKSPVRLFQVLREHELLIQNPEGDSVWTAEIHDFARDWRQKLTFLRFNNDLIWPTANPDAFDGDITPVDRKGNPIVEEKEKQTESAQKSDLGPSQQDHNNYINSEENQAAYTEYDQAASQQQLYLTTELSDITGVESTREKVEAEQNTGKSKGINNHEPSARHNTLASKSPQSAGNNGEPKLVSSTQAKELWKYSRKAQEDILSQNDFITWLLRGMSRRKIRVNEPKAPVHILDSHIALVTPAIFIQYFKNNSLKRRIYEKRAGDKKIYTLLQRELEALDIHQRSTKGQNIVTLVVEGERTQAELKVYLLNRACFPSLQNFTPNKVMKISI